MITQQRLHELFEYREDGFLIWKVDFSSRAKEGNVVGTLNDEGYYIVGIDQKSYKVHRMIFLYHHGYLTDGLQMDHIDGNKTNNRIDNLREVTSQQNAFNRKFSKNTSGVKGVTWSKEKMKWVVQITVDRKCKHLGYYDDLKEAKAAAIAGRDELHGDFARHD